MSEKINLFVSHCGDDEGHVEKLKNLINKGKYDVRDSSVLSTKPNNASSKEYIKSILKKQINWAGTIVVLIGNNTSSRDWVNWEIEYAGKIGNKRIVGVYIQGKTDSEIPEALNNFGDACVAWNLSKIEAVIDGENIWEYCDGSRREENTDERETCSN